MNHNNNIVAYAWSNLNRWLWSSTWHVHHPAVAVLQQVASLTVDAAGRDAVGVEELRVYGGRLTISPRRREVQQLKEPTADGLPLVHKL